MSIDLNDLKYGLIFVSVEHLSFSYVLEKSSAATYIHASAAALNYWALYAWPSCLEPARGLKEKPACCTEAQNWEVGGKSWVYCLHYYWVYSAPSTKGWRSWELAVLWGIRESYNLQWPCQGNHGLLVTFLVEPRRPIKRQQHCTLLYCTIQPSTTAQICQTWARSSWKGCMRKSLLL